jgi:hypothetical protein
MKVELVFVRRAGEEESCQEASGKRSKGAEQNKVPEFGPGEGRD